MSHKEAKEAVEAFRSLPAGSEPRAIVAYIDHLKQQRDRRAAQALTLRETLEDARIEHSKGRAYWDDRIEAEKARAETAEAERDAALVEVARLKAEMDKARNDHSAHPPEHEPSLTVRELDEGDDQC